MNITHWKYYIKVKIGITHKMNKYKTHKGRIRTTSIKYNPNDAFVYHAY